MSIPEKIKVKFISDSEFIEEVENISNDYPNDFTIIEKKEERDAARLGFDIAIAASVVTIITGIFFTVELAAKIKSWLSKNNTNRIIVQTPFGYVEIRKDRDMTEEEVQRLLRRAINL